MKFLTATYRHFFFSDVLSTSDYPTALRLETHKSWLGLMATFMTLNRGPSRIGSTFATSPVAEIKDLGSRILNAEITEKKRYKAALSAYKEFCSAVGRGSLGEAIISPTQGSPGATSTRLLDWFDWTRCQVGQQLAEAVLRECGMTETLTYLLNVSFLTLSPPSAPPYSSQLANFYRQLVPSHFLTTHPNLQPLGDICNMSSSINAAVIWNALNPRSQRSAARIALIPPVLYFDRMNAGLRLIASSLVCLVLQSDITSVSTANDSYSHFSPTSSIAVSVSVSVSPLAHLSVSVSPLPHLCPPERHETLHRHNVCCLHIE